MKKLYMIFACLVIALFILSACKPNIDVEEGSYSVIEEEGASEDIFEELDNIDEELDNDVEEDLDVVIEEPEEEKEEEVVVEDKVIEEKEEVVEEEKEDEPETTTKTESGVYKVTVNEGELVKVELNAKDPDGDALQFSYEKPLDVEGKWQTAMGDDGKYYTTVIVSDGTNNVEVDVLIEVLSVNEDPVLAKLSDIVVEEGETVKIRADATDADGDDLTFSYSGWMKSNTYKTGYDDAGVHKVTVTVSDVMGAEDSQTISVTVKDVNRAPVISGLE
ncbi:MAG: hypothetical protein U9R08_05995 [Nanoarchaeota archaeon]|nr:hypothetical protein [Nanoarchaeota archaeon]